MMDTLLNAKYLYEDNCWGVTEGHIHTRRAEGIPKPTSAYSGMVKTQKSVNISILISFTITALSPPPPSLSLSHTRWLSYYDNSQALTYWNQTRWDVINISANMIWKIYGSYTINTALSVACWGCVQLPQLGIKRGNSVESRRSVYDTGTSQTA
jgi:hypothetical protein